MGTVWSDFAYDVTMKWQADNEWKETIEQRIEDHRNQRTDMEMRITEYMAEIEWSYLKEPGENAGEDRPALGMVGCERRN